MYINFTGGRYGGKTFTRDEVEKISNGTTGTDSKRKELNNQPLVDGYLGPMFNEIDYGLITLRYETQEYYNDMGV